MMIARLLPLFIGMLLLAAPVQAASTAQAPIQETAQGVEQSSEAVMQQFAGDDEISPQRRIDTERKHQILFMMGGALLLLLLLTGGFGIAMVVFNKDLFLPHMICAGLSITLAIVHSATAIAWFWPW